MYGAVHSRSTGRIDSVHRSDDEGQTWVEVSIPTPNTCYSFCWYCLTVGADYADPDVVYVGGVGIYRSSDAGETWESARGRGSSRPGSRT